MENRKKIGSCSKSSKKLTKLTQYFFVAAVDAEDNVTQQLSDPDNDNSNLICGAESALASENISYESIEQN